MRRISARDASSLVFMPAILNPDVIMISILSGSSLFDREPQQ